MKHKGRPKLKVGSIPVSLRADRTYKDAVDHLAKMHNMCVADLIRDALDAKWGSDIKRISEFLVAMHGH